MVGHDPTYMQTEKQIINNSDSFNKICMEVHAFQTTKLFPGYVYKIYANERH